jgi:adenylosuccinate synthase
MGARALIGLQWGDEGKGKMIDILAADVDFVVRCQGGSNAGHTVHIDGESTVLHLIPSGILTDRAHCVIGHGVVVDPGQLLEEIDGLKGRGVTIDGRLSLSGRAHVVAPFHKVIDVMQEKSRGDAKIGTTGRGIGPAYTDKVARCGIRVMDLLDESVLRVKLTASYNDKRAQLDLADDKSDVEGTLALLIEQGQRLAPFICDTVQLLIQAKRAGKRFFLEGAQGSLLDLDVGTYPYVTSSNASTGGLLTGSGLPPTIIDDVIGVTKAYSTRVGEGPYPSELNDDVGQQLRDAGNEYGSTTGRPRRCGWLDAVALRFAVEVNGVTRLALTKVDVLSGLDQIKIAVAYEIRGERTTEFPSALADLEAAQPIYESFSGWSEDISNVRGYDELPQTLRDYIRTMEELTGVPVTWVSNGPGRDAVICR